MEKGLRFTMRGGHNTLGYGVITDLLPHVDIEQYDSERKKAKKLRQKAEKEAAAGAPVV